jgi:hypothetical protein
MLKVMLKVTCIYFALSMQLCTGCLLTGIAADGLHTGKVLYSDFRHVVMLSNGDTVTFYLSLPFDNCNVSVRDIKYAIDSLTGGISMAINRRVVFSDGFNVTGYYGGILLDIGIYKLIINSSTGHSDNEVDRFTLMVECHDNHTCPPSLALHDSYVYTHPSPPSSTTPIPPPPPLPAYILFAIITGLILFTILIFIIAFVFK